MPSRIFFKPRSLSTCFATSRFSIYLKNRHILVLWITTIHIKFDTSLYCECELLQFMTNSNDMQQVESYLIQNKQDTFKLIKCTKIDTFKTNETAEGRVIWLLRSGLRQRTIVHPLRRLCLTQTQYLQYIYKIKSSRPTLRIFVPHQWRMDIIPVDDIFISENDNMTFSVTILTQKHIE